MDTEFESRNDGKFERDEINSENYDHTDIESCPTILFHLCAKQRQPFLTYMWDGKSEWILFSKYVPMKICTGKTGLQSPELTSTGNLTTSSFSSMKRKRQENERTKLDIETIIRSLDKHYPSDKPSNTPQELQVRLKICLMMNCTMWWNSTTFP